MADIDLPTTTQAKDAPSLQQTSEIPAFEASTLGQAPESAVGSSVSAPIDSSAPATGTTSLEVGAPDAQPQVPLMTGLCASVGGLELVDVPTTQRKRGRPRKVPLELPQDDQSRVIQ